MNAAAVTLRNGAVVPVVLVRTTTMALDRLLTDAPDTLYELVQMCRDPEHEPFGNTASVLESYELIRGGRVHDAVRDIVLSAVVGAGADLTLQPPVAGEARP